MKKILMCVFSGTGNTRKIANLFSDEFINNGVETTIVEIKKGARIKCVDDFDAVGVCYPIHSFNAPYNVLEFAHDMPKTHDKPLFVLKSSGEPLALNNVSSYKLVSILKKKGYDYFAEYHYVMPYNMIFRHDDAAAYKMWHTAKNLAPVEAREILSLTPHKLKKNPVRTPCRITVSNRASRNESQRKIFQSRYGKVRELRTLREKLSRRKRKNRGRKICVRRRLRVLRQVQFQLSERRVRHRSSERVARQRKI